MYITVCGGGGVFPQTMACSQKQEFKTGKTLCMYIAVCRGIPALLIWTVVYKHLDGVDTDKTNIVMFTGNSYLPDDLLSTDFHNHHYTNYPDKESLANFSAKIRNAMQKETTTHTGKDAAVHQRTHTLVDRLPFSDVSNRMTVYDMMNLSGEDAENLFLQRVDAAKVFTAEDRKVQEAKDVLSHAQFLQRDKARNGAPAAPRRAIGTGFEEGIDRSSAKNRIDSDAARLKKHFEEHILRFRAEKNRHVTIGSKMNEQEIKHLQYKYNNKLREVRLHCADGSDCSGKEEAILAAEYHTALQGVSEHKKKRKEQFALEELRHKQMFKQLDSNELEGNKISQTYLQKFNEDKKPAMREIFQEHANATATILLEVTEKKKKEKKEKKESRTLKEPKMSKDKKLEQLVAKGIATAMAAHKISTAAPGL